MYFFISWYYIAQYFCWVVFHASISLRILRFPIILVSPLLIFVGAKSIGDLTRYVQFKYKVVKEPLEKRRYVSQKKLIRLDSVMFIFYVIACVIFIQPLSSHVLDMYLDYVPPNFNLLFERTLLVASASIMFSTISLYYNIKGERSWMYGNSFDHFVLCAVVGIAAACDLLLVRKPDNIPTLLFGGAAVIMASGLALGITCSFAFFSKFLVVLSIFSQTK